MSVYVHGQSKAAQAARELEDEARRKVAKLQSINAEIAARLKAQEERLKYLPPVRTYKPTDEQIAYRDQHLAQFESMPEPIHGGRRGLRLAAEEAAQHEKRKKIAA